ncbi:hypothetical protein V8F06_000509 [Rhypophila decipiens]
MWKWHTCSFSNILHFFFSALSCVTASFLPSVLVHHLLAVSVGAYSARRVVPYMIPSSPARPLHRRACNLSNKLRTRICNVMYLTLICRSRVYVGSV